MSMYSVIKYFHILFVCVSFLLFQYRFLLKVYNKPIKKPLLVIPHINDTLLLISAITLAVIAGFNPINQAWLMAKIIALFLYVAFGMVAFKSPGLKGEISYVLATITFIFLVFTAINKTPFLFGI